MASPPVNPPLAQVSWSRPARLSSNTMNNVTESDALPDVLPSFQEISLPHDAERINVAVAMAALTDVFTFIAAIAVGIHLGPAHILSFSIATALFYHLNIQAAANALGRSRDLRLHGHLIIVSLLALFLRGGVLSLFVNVWGWSPSVAIFFAVGASLAITLPGYSLALSSFEWRLGGGTRWRVLALGLIVYAFALRLVYLGQAELLPEEAYYWNYSRHLATGYLDHPPMVAWLIRLGTFAFGGSEFGVRVSAIFCAATTAFFTYRLTRNLFDASTALLATVLSQTLPFFFAAGMVMTPDTPLVAAWAATVFFLERALVAGRSGAWWGVGLCMGVGLLSKYSIVLLAPAALVFMLLDPPARHWLRRWQPYAAALLAVAIFSPVIVWNAQNDWASFAFQTTRRFAEARRFSLHKLILAALVLITPTGVLAVAVALLRRTPDAGGNNQIADALRKQRFLQAVVAVPLAVYFVVSLGHDVKFDWTGEIWLAALPAMASVMMSRTARQCHKFEGRIRAATIPTLLGLLVIYAAGLHFLTLGLPGVAYNEHTELMPVGWRDLGRQVNTIANEIGKTTGIEPLIVGMDRYAIASEVAFYAPDGTTVAPETSSPHLFGWTGLMYERWMPPEEQAGRNLLLVSWKAQDLFGGNCVASRAERLGPLKSAPVMRYSSVVRSFYYRVAYGYRSAAKCT
jgi:dolichol-phosphate mannosyltransferase